MKSILVTGAKGFQGRFVVEELLKSGYHVRALTTVASRIEIKNYTGVVGDFGNVSSLVKAMDQVEGVYFVLPLIFDRDLIISYTENFIKAAKLAKPKIIVFNSSIFVPTATTNILALDIKKKVEGLLRQSNLPIIYFHPRIYLDNIAAPWSVPAILNQNILPYPVLANQQVSWISLYDIGRFTVAAFKRMELIGNAYEIGSEPITGNEMAVSLSDHFNKDIKYVSVGPDDYENGLKGPFGELPAKSISDIYRFVAKNEEDFIVDSQASSIFGVEPLSFSQWLNMIPWEQLNNPVAVPME